MPVARPTPVLVRAKDRPLRTSNIRTAMAHLTLFAALLAGTMSTASAHEPGAPFSGAMIEPLVLHHAHLEDEQRVNLSMLRGAGAAGARKRNAFEGELELAWASSDFRFGMEVFVPFVSWPGVDGARHTSVGDIEIRPIKYAFINKPELVVSIATAIGLPTGDRKKLPEAGNVTLAQYLFVDKAIGNWYVGGNIGVDRRVHGERGSGVEYGAAIAYSFIGATPARGIAPSKPAQQLVVSPSIELIRSKRWSGDEAGEKSLSVVPGVALWWPKSGVQVRAGMSIPLSDAREADRIFLVQIGTHRNWDTLLTRGR